MPRLVYVSLCPYVLEIKNKKFNKLIEKNHQRTCQTVHKWISLEYVKICSTSFTIREKYVETIVRFHFYLLDWKNFKNLTSFQKFDNILSWKVYRKRHLRTLQIHVTPRESNLAISFKFSNICTLWSRNLTLGTYRYKYTWTKC